MKLIKGLVKDVSKIYLTLLKVMVPTIIIVKLLDMLGATEILAMLLSPFMQFVGLPEALGIVWATAILTNIYAAMVVFVSATDGLQLSVAQVSVMGILILLSHSIPVEGAVAKVVGVSWRLTITLKLGGGLLLAALVNWLYQAADYQQQAAILLWSTSIEEQSLGQWCKDQVIMLVGIYFIIMALIVLLKVMRKIGIEWLLQKTLSPIFKLLGITKDASNITIIGLTLGLTFGAGLLISEVRSGKISKRDVLLSICFLSLAHSLVEDTILIMMLGADLGAILWIRIVFAIVIVAMISRFIKGQDGQLSAEKKESLT